MYNLTMTNTRRQAGEKEGRESDEGMEEHALCSSKLSKRKKKRSPDKENSSEEILAIREQRQQRYDVAGGCREGKNKQTKATSGKWE